MSVEDMQIATNVFKYFKLHFRQIELSYLSVWRYLLKLLRIIMVLKCLTSKHQTQLN